MRRDPVKTGIISLILLGSIVQVTACSMKKQQEESSHNEEGPSIETMEPEFHMQPMEIRSEDEVIGVVEMNPNIYSILDGKGYSLDNYPNFSRDVLDSHDYVAFDNRLGVTNTDVNFRTGPGTEYDIIKTLEQDCPVDLIARCDNGWYLVCRDSSLGFIRGDFINEISDKKLSDELENLPEIVPVVQATSVVNIRPEPNTNNTEYGQLSVGNSLEMVRRLDNGWYEVRYEGKTAYVCGEYVKEAYALAGEFSHMAYVDHESALYDVPYGERISSVPMYGSLKIYQEIDGYFYVECDGKIGFIAKSDCNILYGTYVIVDISSQTLTLYRDNQVLLTSDVVTGKTSSPTDIGFFDIDAKATDAWLTGADYSTHVNFWMPYNGGEGLHDATWRSEFGGSIYHEGGSHGCVNCPYDTAETLYNNLSVGDKVLVKE